MTGELIRDRKRHTETGEGHVRMEKKLERFGHRPGTPGATGSWKRQEALSLEAAKEASPRPHLDFELQTSRAVRGYRSAAGIAPPPRPLALWYQETGTGNSEAGGHLAAKRTSPT